MVLIVTGGSTGNDDFDYTHPLSSTEKLTTGATAWTTINPLPRTLAGVATVSMDNSIFLLGGFDGHSDRAEILAFDGEHWKEVGQIKEAKYDLAATRIDITD